MSPGHSDDKEHRRNTEDTGGDKLIIQIFQIKKSLTSIEFI